MASRGKKKTSGSTVKKITGAFNSESIVGKKYSPNVSNLGEAEQIKIGDGDHKTSGNKTKDKIAGIIGDDTTKTVTKKGKGISTSFSQGGITGQKVVPETKSDSSKKTSGTPSSQSTTQQSTPTQSTIDVPLEKTEDVIRREWTPVESYDPYSDEQYARQLQEYRDSIAGEYERQREESDEAYEKNKAAADIAALRRGMGRSSYNLQTMANIDTEAAKARQQITDREAEAAQQFGVQLASELRNNYQWETAQNYQRERDTWSDYYQQLGLNQNQQSLNMQAQQNEIARQQADRNYNYQVGRDQVADQQWQQNFEYQQGRDAVADEQWEKGFQRQTERDRVSDEQWEKGFQQTEKQNEQQQSNVDRQTALSLVQAMAQNGGNPSDALLKAAGISRKDYNAMKKKSGKSSKGGSKSGGKPGNNPPPGNENQDPSDQNLEQQAQTGGSTTGSMPFNPKLPQVIEQKKKEEEEKKKKQGLPKIQPGTVRPTIRK